MSTNFEIAPPPKTVDGLLAVPIDISSVDAAFSFDAATATAAADATITYTVGPTAGNPIFDLRQTIGQAWLDGVPIAPALLGHHAFGSGSFTDLRVIESVQAAGSVHTLRVAYALALPDGQMNGSYLPALDWLSGPTLRFVFGLSDLSRCRYAEAWLPMNLTFDQFSIDLQLRILNTPVAHSVITNATVTTLGANHWQLAFPARFSAVSPLIEVRASSTLAQLTDTVLLPVSGATVTIEAFKPAGSAVSLPAQISAIKGFLADNENDYGAYVHGDRFVAFFNGSGGMEYEGATTTSVGALAHETFHSWFARGIKPASQADGWWDEAFTSFRDDGADDAVALDFTDPPVVLCSRDPWQRHTPTNAYTQGNDLFKGLASMIGTGNLNALMGDLYDARKGALPVTTAQLEEHLTSRSGNPQVVSAFHRFAYGLGDPSPAPELWLRDADADPGADAWSGEFWDSPDVWIRNVDDGATVHQAPEYGQDNWFYARVRNTSTAAATHFVVTFHARGFAGTEFQYPADFLPSITAKAEFDLPAGATRVVRARWPRADVPPAGTHTCLLAAVLHRSDLPVAGRHVWEHNNLAQKNLTVVDLQPAAFLLVPVVVANLSGELDTDFDLELLTRGRQSGLLNASIVHRSKSFFARTETAARRFLPDHPRDRAPDDTAPLDCGGHIGAPAGVGRLLTSDVPELVARRFGDSWEADLPAQGGARLPVQIDRFSQTVVGLRVAVARDAKPGSSTKLHLVQRRRRTKQILGGVAVQVNVTRDGPT